MSVNKYIDIDSSYRNRLEYPEVGDFVVNMNQTTKTTDIFNAIDPVALSFPMDTGRLGDGIWYNTPPITRPSVGPPSPFAPPVPPAAQTVYGSQVIQPLLSLGIATKFLAVQLGAASRDTANFYVGYYLNFPYKYFGTDNYYWLILAYDATTKMCICSTWNLDLDPANFPAIPDVRAYLGPYDGSTTGYVLPYPPTDQTPDEYWIREQLPMHLGLYQDGNFQDKLANPPAVPNTTYTVELGSLASSSDGIYVGMYLFLIPEILITLPYIIFDQQFAYQFQKIVEYDGTTKVATVQSPFLTAPDPAASALGYISYQIVPFSYDNYRSIQYAGTEIFNQPRCVNLSLTNLIIPAYLPLTNSNFGYITDYPFVWVALYSERGATYQQVIMSASPASKLALFKCAVYGSQASKFTQLSPIIGSQSVNFRINDDLRFQILLPNGEPVRFVPSYYAFFSGAFTFFPGLGFPLPPDPQTQVQATFNISFSTR